MAGQKKEDWINRKWRPYMACTYMVICIADFFLFPILWVVFLAYLKQPITPWDPVTLKGAGLLHMAMGAVLGVTAYGRSKEKLAGVQDSGNSSTLPEGN